MTRVLNLAIFVLQHKIQKIIADKLTQVES